MGFSEATDDESSPLLERSLYFDIGIAMVVVCVYRCVWESME